MILLFFTNQSEPVVEVEQKVFIAEKLDNWSYYIDLSPLNTRFQALGKSQDVGIVTTTGDYSISTNETAIMCDATAGDITVNLPTASENEGRIIVAKKVDSSINSVFVDGFDTETIDGDLAKELTTQYESVTVISDGLNWYIV